MDRVGLFERVSNATILANADPDDLDGDGIHGRHNTDSGAVHVLHNRCTHKGAKLVDTRCGNARAFRCCYHGWTFATDFGVGFPILIDETSSVSRA